jgi:DNA-directed RNA polymerase specialized sigma24 family protein
VQAAIPALRRYARALTRDAEIADDLVQDTLVRALRSEHLFHEGDVRRDRDRLLKVAQSVYDQEITPADKKPG